MSKLVRFGDLAVCFDKIIFLQAYNNVWTVALSDGTCYKSDPTLDQSTTYHAILNYFKNPPQSHLRLFGEVAIDNRKIISIQLYDKADQKTIYVKLEGLKEYISTTEQLSYTIYHDLMDYFNETILSSDMLI